MRIRSRYIALSIAAGVLLTGCARPGTAATVNGERITEDSVSVLAADMTELQGSETPPSSALQSLIISGPVLEVASETGNGVSPQQGVELLDGIVAQSGAQPWDYSDELVLVAQMSVAVQSTDEEFTTAIQTALEEAEVEVSPRYGAWDAAEGVQGAVWPWIVSSSSSAALG